MQTTKSPVKGLFVSIHCNDYSPCSVRCISSGTHFMQSPQASQSAQSLSCRQLTQQRPRNNDIRPGPVNATPSAAAT
ncbi:MAG: hypothetical protein R3330_17865, partial [Saprospiraceae bacterium]|nr:hypothetical protein [Saprospiraceae bacterium]